MCLRRARAARRPDLIDAHGHRTPERAFWIETSRRRSSRDARSTCGAKVHLIYDVGSQGGPRPQAAVTAALFQRPGASGGRDWWPTKADLAAAGDFDLGYYDYAWWAKRDMFPPKAVIETTSFRVSSTRRCSTLSPNSMPREDGDIAVRPHPPVDHGPEPKTDMNHGHPTTVHEVRIKTDHGQCSRASSPIRPRQRATFGPGDRPSGGGTPAKGHRAVLRLDQAKPQDPTLLRP